MWWIRAVPITKDTHTSYLQGMQFGFRAWNALNPRGIFQAHRSSFSTRPTLFPLERSRDPGQRYWGCRDQKEVTLLQRGKNWKVSWTTSATFPKKLSVFIAMLSYACTSSLWAWWFIQQTMSLRPCASFSQERQQSVEILDSGARLPGFQSWACVHWLCNLRHIEFPMCHFTWESTREIIYFKR